MLPRSSAGLSDDTQPVEERGLLDFIAVLWRWKVAIVAAALIAGVAALTTGRKAPLAYESATTVAIGPTRAGVIPDVTSTVASFRALLENNSIARETIDELHLSNPPYSLTPAAVLDGVSVEEVRGTTYLRVRVRLGDPQVAASVANSLVTRAIALNELTARKADMAVRDSMKEALDQASADLDRTGKRLADYKATAEVDLTESDARFLVDQRSRLQEVDLEIGIERSRLASAQEQLAKASNSDRQAAQEDVGSLQSRISALERERQGLSRVTGKDTTTRLRQLHQKQTEVERLKAEFEAAQATYADAWKAYAQARAHVGSRTPQFSIVDPAQPAAAPLVQRRFSAVLATLLALVFASAAAVAYEWRPR